MSDSLDLGLNSVIRIDNQKIEIGIGFKVRFHE
jgi:hypothetical protein